MEAKTIEKELRIGNWVFVYGKNTQVTIGGLAVFQYDCKPIELNEEWLVKFGFSKHNKEGSTIINYSIVKDDWDYFTVFAIDIKKGLGFAGCKYKIKYVNQLQNLYFTLTGEELEINP